MSLVTPDASATAAWLLPDEASPSADARFHEAVEIAGRFQAPSLWMWESGKLLRSARAAAQRGVVCLSL